MGDRGKISRNTEGRVGFPRKPRPSPVLFPPEACHAAKSFIQTLKLQPPGSLRLGFVDVLPYRLQLPLNTMLGV